MLRYRLAVTREQLWQAMAALAGEPFYLSPRDIDALELDDCARWLDQWRRWRQTVR